MKAVKVKNGVIYYRCKIVKKLLSSGPILEEKCIRLSDAAA